MEYQNQFNLTEQLAQTISKIISRREKHPYICQIIKLSLPEQKMTVISSPGESWTNWGGPSLSGAVIRAIQEEYGTPVETVQSACDEHYLVVIKKENLETISCMNFASKAEIKEALQTYATLYDEYNGIFDSTIFYSEFPYLQEFFSYLDTWRESTGRVTLDSDVLKKSMRSIKN